MPAGQRILGLTASKQAGRYHIHITVRSRTVAVANKPCLLVLFQLSFSLEIVSAPGSVSANETNQDTGPLQRETEREREPLRSVVLIQMFLLFYFLPLFVCFLSRIPCFFILFITM